MEKEDSHKTLWEILVPKVSNDGKLYTVEHHQQWDAQVRDLAGGITILKTAKGQWKNPNGQLFRDEMIPVRIYCTEQHIDDIIQKTITHYDQEAVLAYEISTNVKLIYR